MNAFTVEFNILGQNYTMGAYTIFFLLAVAIAVVGGTWFGARRGYDWRQLLVILGGMLLAGLIGARLLDVATNWSAYQDDTQRIWMLSATGFSLYGGIMPAVLVGYLLARYFRLNALQLGDNLVPLLGLSIASMRVGCFLDGCCFGHETNLPWGVTFPLASPAHLHQIGEHGNLLTVHPVHPTQLYELIAAVLLSVIAFYLLRKKQPPGRVLVIFITFFSMFRWFNAGFRVQPGSFTISSYFFPMIYALIIAAGVTLLTHKKLLATPN